MTTKKPVSLLEHDKQQVELRNFILNIPYATYLGIDFILKNNKLVTLLPFNSKLIGNPALPALHGGVTASFLEIAAILELYWFTVCELRESDGSSASNFNTASNVSKSTIPKTIDFTVDYLRPGLPQNAYAHAEIKRAGRRYASITVEAWQDNKRKLYAQASGHFLMSSNDG